MAKFAIIETGGKQYKVELGTKIKIEKLGVPKGEKISLDKVLLLVDGDTIEIGTPYIKNAAIEAEVAEVGKADKKIVFRYHAKTRYRKFKGHRQPFTEIKVKKV
ncbi:MAG: 50S ribosomal protein L21 [Candidatus Paceibacterota bacterium]|jgi:large subunit ribosomal protein L21